jgi:tRNA modification GTPase
VNPDPVCGTADRPDTIFALSSGALPAAIAVVRISGPAGGDALRQLAGALPEPRRATLRTLRAQDGQALDQALILWFPGPASATGEDLAELHLHGGRAVAAAVLAALAACPGCRAAEPGAFTRRAFANGRIDLAEAEGLADLLAAETESARKQALRMAEGGLSREIETVRRRLLELAARAEAVLEFGDDGDDVGADPGFAADLERLIADLEAALSLPPAERLRDGFRVVVAGPPNAGKSSLINAMAGRDAAIASPEPGTTRDLIEVPLALDGIALILIDSAGLRDSDHVVERIGIDRAERALAGADLVLWLGAAEACPRRDAALLVHSRCDQPGRERLPVGYDLAVSATTGAGLAALRDALIERLARLLPPPDRLLMTERQRELLRCSITELSAARAAALPEVAAEHVRLALRELDRITGRADVEFMLDALFGRFCIGK